VQLQLCTPACPAADRGRLAGFKQAAAQHAPCVAPLCPLLDLLRAALALLWLLLREPAGLPLATKVGLCAQCSPTVTHCAHVSKKPVRHVLTTDDCRPCRLHCMVCEHRK
jgi:hypothetical protein